MKNNLFSIRRPNKTIWFVLYALLLHVCEANIDNRRDIHIQCIHIQAIFITQHEICLKIYFDKYRVTWGFSVLFECRSQLWLIGVVRSCLDSSYRGLLMVNHVSRPRVWYYRSVGIIVHLLNGLYVLRSFVGALNASYHKEIVSFS